jgi:hypothetical protein
MSNKNYKIKDFIGTFDGYISKEICENLINLFEKEQQHQKKVFNRKDGEGTSSKFKNDVSMILTRDSLGNEYKLFIELLKSFRECLGIYLKDTDYLDFAGIRELHFVENKIQKTIPSGGYHIWHVERDYNNPCGRALVYTIYLNDVLAGGETEFLFQKTRVSAKQGRVCIFPAQFPYVHRGNPPLDKEKYIVTSWLHTSYNPN